MNKNRTPVLTLDYSLLKHGFCILANLEETNEFLACSELDASATLREQTGSQVAVLYRPPVEALGTLLAENASLADALTGWTHTLTNLLRLQRKYRRRMSFVEAPDIEAPDIKVPSLKTKAALGEIISIITPNGYKWPDRVHSFEPLAVILLDSDPTIHELTEELKAATHGGCSQIPDMAEALEALASTISGQRKCERQAKEILKISEANAQSLVQQTQRCKDLQVQVKDLQDMGFKEEYVSGRLQEQVIDLENALVELEHDRQKTLAEKRIIEDAKQSLEREHHRRVEELTYALQLVYSSTSWRITAPARAIMKHLKR